MPGGVRDQILWYATSYPGARSRGLGTPAESRESPDETPACQKERAQKIHEVVQVFSRFSTLRCF